MQEGLLEGEPGWDLSAAVSTGYVALALWVIGVLGRVQTRPAHGGSQSGCHVGSRPWQGEDGSGSSSGTGLPDERDVGYGEWRVMPRVRECSGRTLREAQVLAHVPFRETILNLQLKPQRTDPTPRWNSRV